MLCTRRPGVSLMNDTGGFQIGDTVRLVGRAWLDMYGQNWTDMRVTVEYTSHGDAYFKGPDGLLWFVDHERGGEWQGILKFRPSDTERKKQ